MSTTITIEQLREHFRATATDEIARKEYAWSRAEVILPLLQDQSTIRAIFAPTYIGGAEARWDIPFDDIECTWVLPQIGGIPTVQVEAAEVHADTFGVEGAVEYQQDIARDGRVDIAGLSTTLLKNRFIRQEEMAGWSLIRTHAAVLPATQKFQAFKDDGTVGAAGTGRLNIHTINEALTLADSIGVGGRRVTDIYVSPRRFGDLRSVLTMEALPPSLREKLYGSGVNPGAPGELRVHKVYNADLVSDNKGYAFTQKDGYRYGYMPIREHLTTKDNPLSEMEWKIGIIGRERIGFVVFDDKGLIEITF
ncbi:MAG: hypothetical protein FWD53_13585 [Phycisphaerales bacterium]|nr:hypothetical protein [Phycisphaerales bacterium]